MKTSQQIYERLANTDSEEEKGQILEELDEEHELWFCLHYILYPLKRFPFNFKLLDPKTFGNGIKDGILKKIIEKVQSGELSDNNAADALTAFSHYCSKEQWYEWFKPFLERELTPPITVPLFNEYCPWKYRIKPPEISKFDSLKENSKISSLLVVEPLYEYRRVFIVVDKNKTWVMDSDGTPLHIELPPVLKKVNVSNTIIFEAYENESYFIIRDILLREQLEGNTPIAPVQGRLKIAEDALKSMLGNSFETSTPFELIEYYTSDLSEDANAFYEDLEVVFEAGHKGIVFRSSNAGYHEDHANIIVKPARRSVLTCVDIISGNDGTKYENKALYLLGKGTINKKKFTSQVRFGLTSVQRELCFRDREKIKGNKFLVLSCGLDKDGQQLLFPVFQYWR